MDSTTTGGASSSSSLPSSWTYDVFLSFRGEDTRNNFTGHLYSNLIQKGIKTFIDDEVLRRGEDISQALLTAIEESRISVIVFSQNYADSKWCLDELVHIFHCKESKKQKVFPIFYKVDPSDVRRQRKSYGKALADHECRFKDNMEKVLRWRTTLTQAANLSGCSFLDGCHESKFIQEIVKEMGVQILDCTDLDVAKYPVGIESRVRDTYRLLDVGGKDARMVGIWGGGGIGKTTIAKAVYNSISHEFEGSCFLGNVRERSMPYEGLVELQNILLYDILGAKELKLTNVDQGINLIKKRLSHKRVLIILDDVDHLDQLNKLAGGYDWFGSGSRIIITTRDKHLLTAHQVKLIYKVKELDSHEALDLFIRWNGFPRNVNLDDDYLKRANIVVEYAHGLPLVLKVLGSHLCGRRMDLWDAALSGAPHPDIQKTLKISYDALEDSVKEVFLDIACFFKGKHMNHVIPILEGCDLNPKYAMEVLVEKALIDIEQYKIGMHDLLEELGKAIVRQESPDEPGERSRLWFHEDVYHVLTESTGTNKVKGIMVKFPKPDEIFLSDDSFSQMKNLRLFINVNAQFFGDHVKYLSNQLRFLYWPECPLKALPSSFNPTKLVELYMPRSRLSGLGEGLKRMQNLTSMNFERCEFLTETLDISGIPNLVDLNLSYCTSLSEVHPSVGFHDKLVRLNLFGCHNLTIFGKLNLKSLEELNLEHCTGLENFPEVGEKMGSLRSLFLRGSGIKELPSSIVYLIHLECLDLQHCESLTNLPSSLYELQHLNSLGLSGCRKLLRLPNKSKSAVSESELHTLARSDDSNISHDNCDSLALPNLEGLDVMESSFSEINFLEALDCVSTFRDLILYANDFLVSIPLCITKFVNLHNLDLHGCKRLREIPDLPPKVVKVDVSGCLSLETFSLLSNILERPKDSQIIAWMNLSNCQRLLGNLAGGVIKMKSILGNDQVGLFFERFLLSQKSGFQVVFPMSFEAPSKLFRCRKDLKELDESCEFLIEIPQRLKWQNEGLALYLAVENPENQSLDPNPGVTDKSWGNCHSFLAKIYINNQHRYFARVDDGFRRIESGHVWLCYVRFEDMFNWEDPWLRQHPPSVCRVNFQNLIRDSVCFKSCGVHLVRMTEEDEDMSISMGVLVNEDTNNRLDQDIVPSVVADDGAGNADLEDNHFSENDDLEDNYFSCEDDEGLEAIC